jgi:hypothetical protein
MKNKNFLSFYNEIIKTIFSYLKKIKNSFIEFDKKYPDSSQKIQLSFIYFFAVIDLIYSVLNNVFSLGYLSETVSPFFTTIQGILQSPVFKIWASPEKVFFMSYIVLEFMVIRSELNLSKFIRYNILLVFALLMLQGLIISFWDLIFHREISDAISNWTYDEGFLIGTNRTLAVSFFLFTFVIFIALFYYFYSNALKGKIVTIPNFYWITDSVAFWLRIKTPTMRFGWKNRKKDSDDD